MASTEYAAVINVKEKMRQGQQWVISSDDLPGLLLWGSDLQELRADLPAVIKGLFRLNCGMDVEVGIIV